MGYVNITTTFILACVPPISGVIAQEIGNPSERFFLQETQTPSQFRQKILILI